MKALIEYFKTSKDLRSIMESVLLVGNYLNQGTAKGEARGFRLWSLSKV